MPVVGTRRNPNMGNFSKDPMYQYACAFNETQQNILNESSLDYSTDPVRAVSYQDSYDALKEFFVENSCIGTPDQIGAEKYQDNLTMMDEAFINDIQGIRESATTALNKFMPIIGLSLPMHKYLMLNCMFAQAIPRFVAKSPSWTETMETRYFITPDGKKIDIANQQNQIYSAWKGVNAPVEVAITLPERRTVDILDKYFHTSRTIGNLSVATHIGAIAVEDYAVAGDKVLTIAEDGTITESDATEDGVAIVWKPWKAEFTPGYGEANRVIVKPVDLVLTGADGNAVEFHDTLFATQQDNMFEINASQIKAVKMIARYDASQRNLQTPKVEWQERTTFVQIPESDGITVPVTPEEVKDIGALYGINQITKYMSMIKDVLENVKDDDIKEHLDESFIRLDDEHKLAKTIDFAPRDGYYGTHLEWLQGTFMDTLDQFITGLITVLRDPNMEINIIGRPGLIRKITPIEYSYTTPSSVGAIELSFKKTVVTSDKRVYNFISSDKMYGNDNLIVLLNPKNTNRIVYRLYDYQMYISNEIRDAALPALPALTAFQRYKLFDYQPVQGRLFIANPSGLREHLPNVDPIGNGYNNSDLASVYTHYDPTTGKNVTTPNTL